MARSTHHRHYQGLLLLLRELREKSGVTQASLGQKLDNTQTFISKLERGERRVDVVEFVEICEALDTDPVDAFAQFVDRRRSDRIADPQQTRGKTTKRR